MMMDTDAGRTPSEPGSIASGDEAASRLRPSGDDPLRGEGGGPGHRAHQAFDRWADRHPDAPAYWFRLPSWVQEYAAECVRQTERRLTASPVSLLSGTEQVTREAFGHTVDGIGASYSRETDSWTLYTMPGVEPFATVQGWRRQRLDWIVDALRDALATPEQSVTIRDSDTHPKGGDASGSGSAE